MFAARSTTTGIRLVVEPVRQLSSVRYDGARQGELSAPPHPVRARQSGQLTCCNPDFNVWQLGVVTRWTPVKNLTFSAEVM